MRVIAGRYRSRKLEAPPGRAVRPTSDRLRETLFNVVAPRTPDSTWIDLFAGSGAVGIEALSRGAQHVYFIERDKRSAAVIRENLNELEIEESFEIVQGEAVAALRELDRRGVTCDIIFLDPPYAEEDAYASALTALAASRLLRPGGQVIVEHEKHFDPGATVGGLSRFRELRQGDAVLSFYRHAEA